MSVTWPIRVVKLSELKLLIVCTRQARPCWCRLNYYVFTTTKCYFAAKSVILLQRTYMYNIFISDLHVYTNDVITFISELFSWFYIIFCSDKYIRFCQWKNLELNIQLTMNDFSVHRIIGRGGFGEVYGCRKADTGKMWVRTRAVCVKFLATVDGCWLPPSRIFLLPCKQ